jgi:ribosomal protein L7Ae-like RNA K-turn-binding protein
MAPRRGPRTRQEELKMSGNVHFVAAKNRKELAKKVNIHQYSKIVRVTGGYLCFIYMNDYYVWVKQR